MLTVSDTQGVQGQQPYTVGACKPLGALILEVLATSNHFHTTTNKDWCILLMDIKSKRLALHVADLVTLQLTGPLAICCIQHMVLNTSTHRVFTTHTWVSSTFRYMEYLGQVNTAIYPYGQMGQNVPGGHGYTSLQGYGVPGHQIVQFSGPSVNAITTSPMPTVQAPYPAGIAAPVPAQPQFLVPAPSQFMQGSGSDQTTG
ncbi:hypothetical protein Patl1_09338 [Pistacia atlantica]|uniref:Uncharacterized protein n=1 Tax=Pistacia atlantica TaxID=434234 RepID=A0ACC1AGT0_9ROSI|nr:hypothetical protein Patl1_09338 [Pistacia atlantica]